MNIMLKYQTKWELRRLHYSDVIMSAMASEIAGVSIVCLLNIKGARHWPLLGESTGNRWIPLTKVQ